MLNAVAVILGCLMDFHPVPGGTVDEDLKAVTEIGIVRVGLAHPTTRNLRNVHHMNLESLSMIDGM